jgi:Predicted transcriptional regulators
MQENIQGTILEEYENAAEKLKSLAHPKRLEILAQLVKLGNANVTALQDATDLPQPTLSQHLARMQRSGVLLRTKRGTQVFYSLSDPATVEGLKLLCDVDLMA